MEAKSLRILMTERGETRVSLTFRADLAGILPELIPAEVRPRLAAHAIDVPELAARARASGFAPAEIFALAEEQRSLRVWLE